MLTMRGSCSLRCSLLPPRCSRSLWELGVLCYPGGQNQLVSGGLGVPGWQGVPHAGLALSRESDTHLVPERVLVNMGMTLPEGQGHRGLWGWRSHPQNVPRVQG